MKIKVFSIAAIFFIFVTGNLQLAAASTLVYCSEGSPETFNPQLSTSGTTFDASSRQLYNRLVEFKPGTTEIVPGLASSWEISKECCTVSTANGILQLPGIRFPEASTNIITTWALIA